MLGHAKVPTVKVNKIIKVAGVSYVHLIIVAIKLLHCQKRGESIELSPWLHLELDDLLQNSALYNTRSVLAELKKVWLRNKCRL